MSSKGWRGGRLLAWGGLILGVLVIMPPVADTMLLPLEPPQPVSTTDLNKAQAIVILGAGITTRAPEYGGQTVNRLTLERLRYGARLARQTGLPILVTGGAAKENLMPEGVLMAEALATDFQIPPRWTENAALNTRENARNSANLLKSEGITHIALVTHAAHIPRASREFEQQGLTVIAAPTAWLRRGDNSGVGLPGNSSATASWVAIHEWIGRLLYRVTQ